MSHASTLVIAENLKRAGLNMDASPAGPATKSFNPSVAPGFKEPDPAKRDALLDAVQARAYEVVPYVNAAQFRTLATYRANVHGLRPTAAWAIDEASAVRLLALDAPVTRSYRLITESSS